MNKAHTIEQTTEGRFPSNPRLYIIDALKGLGRKVTLLRLNVGQSPEFGRDLYRYWPPMFTIKATNTEDMANKLQEVAQNMLDQAEPYGIKITEFVVFYRPLETEEITGQIIFNGAMLALK